MGSLLCFLGIHRWEFQDVRQGVRLGTFARCRRRCHRYYNWSLVNVDVLGEPWRR